MDPSKLKTMSKWSISRKKKQIQVFLAFANYYHRFIVNYSTKVRLFINFTKAVAFTLEHAQQEAFNELGAQFLSPPILTQFDRTLATIMHTHASNQAIAGILSKCYVVN